LLEQQVRTAQQRGEIRHEIDSMQLAFELDACFGAANYQYILSVPAT
jgi:hypothetical protein